MEFAGATETAALQAVEDKLRRNVSDLLSNMDDHNIPPRQAAVHRATKRIKRAMSFRRWSVF